MFSYWEFLKIGEKVFVLLPSTAFLKWIWGVLGDSVYIEGCGSWDFFGNYFPILFRRFDDIWFHLNVEARLSTNSNVPTVVGILILANKNNANQIKWNIVHLGTWMRIDLCWGESDIGMTRTWIILHCCFLAFSNLQNRRNNCYFHVPRSSIFQWIASMFKYQD